MSEEGAESVARTAHALGLIAVMVVFAVLLGRGYAFTLTGSTPAGNWETVFVETFDRELGPGWTAVDASDGDSGNVTWGTSPYTYTSPEYSAWSVGGGLDGSQLEPGSPYPKGVDAWLVYGPVDLSGVHQARLEFQWWLETGDVARDPTPGARRNLPGVTDVQTVERVGGPPAGGDWFGWCVLTEEMDFETARCEYVSGAIGRWLSASMGLPAGDGEGDEIWIGFHFVSDGDGVAGCGAFVDDVTVLVRPQPHLFLPLLRRDPAPTPTPTPEPTPTPTAVPPAWGVLKNGGFEADWAAHRGTHRAAVYRADGSAREENPEGIRTPPGWLTWFREIPGVGGEPRVAGVSMMDEERRVLSGEAALEIATTGRPHDAGLFQQVDVEPGSTVTLSAWSHAWSNNSGGPPGQEEDAGWSEGVGFDCFFAEEGADDLTSDLENFTFRVGIDPTGGVDPDAPTVVWGDGAHTYNCYHEVPAVQAEARSRRVTVFLRSRARWEFEHNHAYWDEVELSVVDADGGGDGSDWPYPVFQRGSRIGVHSIHPNEVGRFAEELVVGGTYFPVVKAVDDLGWLKGIKETSPETILVARVASPLEAAQNVEDPGTDLDEMARGLMSFILNELTKDARLRGVVEYWEVVNEPDPPGPDGDPNNPEGYRRLAELMIRCMEKAERYGLKLALFSLNAGTPEWDQMEAMVETGVFVRAKEGGHILALHEGTFGDTYDPSDGWEGTIPGAPEGIEGAGSMNFRYRYLYHLLEQRDEVIPLVVSEWYCGDVREGAVDTETIIEALAWYDDEASKDYYHWGPLPFTLGTGSPPDGMWWWSNWERFYPGLVQHMIATRDRENALPPAQSLWETLLWMLGWR